MRIVIEWPEKQHPGSEFFEQLRASGGRWVEVPTADRLSIPGGKPLTSNQLGAIIDASIQSSTQPLDAIEGKVG